MWKIKRLGNKGQNTAEYAILLGLVIAGAIAMQTYVKRGVQGRVHDASDRYYDKVSTDANWANIGASTVEESAKKQQYEPEKFSSKSTQETLEDAEKTTMATGGTVSRESTQRTKQAADDYQKYDY